MHLFAYNFAFVSSAISHRDNSSNGMRAPFSHKSQTRATRNLFTSESCPHSLLNVASTRVRALDVVKVSYSPGCGPQVAHRECKLNEKLVILQDDIKKFNFYSYLWTNVRTIANRNISLSTVYPCIWTPRIIFLLINSQCFSEKSNSVSDCSEPEPNLRWVTDVTCWNRSIRTWSQLCDVIHPSRVWFKSSAVKNATNDSPN